MNYKVDQPKPLTKLQDTMTLAAFVDMAPARTYPVAEEDSPGMGSPEVGNPGVGILAGGTPGVRYLINETSTKC